MRLVSVPIFTIIYYSIWRSIFYTSEIETLGGVTFYQMIVYSTLGQIIASFMEMETIFDIQKRVTSGDIAVDFNKPYDLQWYFFSISIGRSLFTLFFQIPIAYLLLYVLLGDLLIPSNLIVWGAFILAISFSFFIIYNFNFCIGMLSFWIWETEAIDRLQYSLMVFLSGSVVPLWFYPKILEKIGKFLPYQYMFQFPMSIYIGKISLTEIPLNLMMSLIWCLILLGISRMVYRLAVKSVTIQGG